MGDTPVSTTTLRWAIRILWLHTLVMLAVVVLTIWAAFASESMSTESAIATPAFFVLLTVIFGGLAFALHQMRGWARGPAIVLEMLLIPLGWIMLSGVAVIGICIVATGFAGTVLLLAPSTRQALGLNRGSTS